MKRQNSPNLRLSDNSRTSSALLQIQPFSKTFKKKYQAYESPSMNSTTNLIKTFSKNRIKELARSPYQKQSSAKKIERKSTSRNKIDHHTEKTSLHSNGYQQTNMTTTSKLVLINNIFGRKTLSNEPKELLSKFYSQNEQYRQILYEWQKLQIYDEVDKLIYKLTQSCVRVLEDIITKSFLPLSAKMQAYEVCMSELIEQNKKLKVQVQRIKQKQTAFSIVFQNLQQQFQKNQWSNVILAQLSANLDLQAFVRNTQIFRRITGSSYINNDLSQLFTNSCILPNKQIDNDQKPQQKQESDIRQTKTLQKVKSATNIIQDRNGD